jgi:hypothetical protein
MRVGRQRGLIPPHVSRAEDARELLERLRTARTIVVIDHLRVMPLFELQYLLHLWQDADSPLIRRCENIVPSDVSKEAA